MTRGSCSFVALREKKKIALELLRRNFFYISNNTCMTTYLANTRTINSLIRDSQTRQYQHTQYKAKVLIIIHSQNIYLLLLVMNFKLFSVQLFGLFVLH